MTDDLQLLADQIRACRLCEAELPLGPHPVLQVDARARILIAAQAPGTRVHETGIPFNDPSGDRLRAWMGVDRELFYDATQIALVPMGFCYPGKGKFGDLAPKPLCAATWRAQLLALLPDIRLTLVIGQYAQRWHLDKPGVSLTATVQAWADYGPGIIPLPHPSPRNNIWLKKNPWFATSVLPRLRKQVAKVLASPPVEVT